MTSGFDSLAHDLRVAGEALASLDGELATVRFDPNDPASIESAIVEMENKVDEKLAPYATNPIIKSLSSEFKELYRNGILERASEARLTGEAQ